MANLGRDGWIKHGRGYRILKLILRFLEESDISFPFSSFTPESAEEVLPSSLIVQDVRIIPSHMHFDNAYEGKNYKQKLTIQNCGNHLAFIRLCEPNSPTFEFKSFTKGLYLSPGMRIVRVVNYTYRRASGVLKGLASIWINNEEIIYKFVVTLNSSILVVEPQVLDFGRIDMNRAVNRTFQIRNDGFKDSHFAIDLGRNPLLLNVWPMKGSILAKSSVTISVEIIGSNDGKFTQEFWLKTNPPSRVVVTGVFILPKLLVRKFISSLDFTLVDFPPTYYGSTHTKSLFIKNFSSSDSMFCVMAEINGCTTILKEARELDDNYKNFIIKPTEGRLAAQKGALIQITFAPIKTQKKDNNYAACFLKVIRMDCRDVDDDQIYRSPIPQRQTVFDDILSSTSRDEHLSEETIDEAISFDEDASEEHITFESSIKVCIHGKKEISVVSLRPTALYLNKLTLDQCYQREVEITNKSENLPIRVRYNKVAAVDVRPLEFEIKPAESLQVLVTIRTLKLGAVVRKVTFDLLQRGDKNVIRKVGIACLRIDVETSEVVKQKQLQHCKFSQSLQPMLAPSVPYRLTGLELARKIQNDNYYLSYIRNFRKIPLDDKKPEEYAITNSKLVMLENVKCQKPWPRGEKVTCITPFVPLMPSFLYNIKITPKSIRLRKVAAFTTTSDFFQIENLNTFPIRIFVKPSKPCIAFDNFSRYVIRGKEKKNITFSFHTTTTGRYYVNINVLVNDSTLYEVSAVANVVPKTLKVSSDDVVFEETDGHHKFLRLINNLNAFANFDWKIPPSCFQIYPESGGIQAERSVLCAIAYSPDLTQPTTAECVLTSESGRQKIITITSKRRQNLVVFDTEEIDVGLITLNVAVSKKLVLRNLKNFIINYRIPLEISVPGISIEPKEGMLKGLDSQVFRITILLKAVIEFETSIIFLIDETEEIKISLRGSVEYPRFVLKPSNLSFRKIAPHSYDTLAFKAKNLSQCEITVTFPADEFQDFTITASENEQYPHQEKIVLHGNQSKILYLHYHPVYVSTYYSYLCYIINDILGPSYITSGTTTTTKYFLEKNTIIYEDNPDVVVKDIPRNLSVLRVNSSAMEKKLEFLNLNINFFYFGEGHYNNKVISDFEITNISTETAAICIRIDDLRTPFDLVPKTETNFEYYDLSYKIVLEPGEKMLFEAGFHPVHITKCVIKLPIFLRNYYDNKIFNYLTLRGIYDKPTISSSVERCDFAPIPCRITNKIPLILRFENHFEDCTVSATNEMNLIYASFTNGRRPQTRVSYLNVVVICECARTQSFDTVLEFTCTCDATFEIPVTGIAENCLLTTHVYSFLLRNSLGPPLYTNYIKLLENYDTCYPLFPSDDDDSEHGKYMKSLQRALENWVCCQGFYMKSYYRIPEGFTEFCKVSEPWRKLTLGGVRKPKTQELPLLQLVMNFAGPQIRDELAESLPDTRDEDAWLTYTSQTISNILYYLRGFSVFLPHVRTKYLLSYDQYLVYEKVKRPDCKPLDETIFYRLSKQCYIDLILQIIKSFVLFRTMSFPKSTVKCRTSTCSAGRISKSSMTSEASGEYVFDIGIYGRHEKYLIDWLQEIYNLEKTSLWKEPLKDKQIGFLDEDLNDGLILGSVTAHYCPYIKSEIQDMYSNPKSPEESHHNACTLINTWKMLNLSYVITPQQFEKCGIVEMLLLVLYLYTVLPNCTPSETITIEALLTQTSTRSITLENLGEDPIFYKVLFFGNEAQLFQVAQSMVKIKPGTKKTIVVEYHAKTVNTTTATILFSGETPGQKYGKSLAVTLVGTADVSYACMEIPLTVDLYEPCHIKLHIVSPFKTAAEYSLSFGYNPATKENASLFPWEEIKNLKIIRQFVLQDDMCQFNDNGECTTTQFVCCQEIGPRDMWFYFTNPDVGDWGIKIILTGKVTNRCYEDIEVCLPDNYNSLVCRCKQRPSVTKNCPMILHAMVPMTNQRLWNARKSMILRNVEGQELEFWSKHIYTPTGTRILKLILNSETHPMRQFITDRVEYRVVLDASAPFVTLRSVTLEDVTSEDFYSLPIHPLKKVDLHQVEKCNLHLISADKCETRFYKLQFRSASDSVL